MSITETSQQTTTSDQWVATAHEIGIALRPTVEDRDSSGQIAVEAFQRLRRDGITAALVPEEFGGGGATHADIAGVIRELGRHDPATALTLSMHSHVVATQVWRHRHGLDATGAFHKVVDDAAMIVTTGASDWVESNGTATKVAGGFRVSARKAPISGCEVADVFFTSFRWETDEGTKVVHCTIPSGTDGLSIDQTWDTLGLRATGSHTVVFDDVFVPDAAVGVVRPADEWHPFLNAVLGCALPLIMSAYVGIADAAVDEVRVMVAGRTDPHVIQLVGEMINAHTTAVDAVAAMIADSDDLHFDNSDEYGSRTLSRKTIASEAVIDCVRLAIEATGGFGYTRRSPLERLFRDVHGCLFHPLPRAKQVRFTGRVGVGATPFG